MENQNTEVVTGQNQQEINYEALAETVANAVAKRSAKVEKSIVEDNFGKLSEDEREQAYRAWNDLKAKEANKTSNKIAQLEKDNAALLQKVQEFETKEKNQLFKSAANQTLNEMGLKESSKISLLMDLAGQSLFDCVDDDKNYNGEKAKILFNDIAKKYEIKLEETKEEAPQIQIGAKKQEQTNTNSTLDQYRRVLGIIK